MLSTMELAQPAPADLELTAVLHAFSDPGRLRIVQILATDTEPRPCGNFGLELDEVHDEPPLPCPARGGRDRAVARGTCKLSALRREDLDARFPGLLDAVLAPAAVA